MLSTIRNPIIATFYIILIFFQIKLKTHYLEERTEPRIVRVVEEVDYGSMNIIALVISAKTVLEIGWNRNVYVLNLNLTNLISLIAVNL